MKRALMFVLAALFLLLVGTFISGTILTPYARSMGATWFQIGILSGGMYAVRLFIGAPVGKIADRKGTLVVLKYSMLMFPFIAIAYYFTFDIYSLIGVRMLHGVASAMLLPMGMAYVGEVSPEGQEGRYMGFYNLCFLLGSGIGPFISTAVVGVSSYKTAFVLLFALAVAAFLIIMPIRNNASTSSHIHHETETKKKIADLLKNRGLMALSAANVSLSIVSSLVGFFIIPFLESRGVDFIITGSIVAIYNIVSGVLQLPSGKIIDRHNKFMIALISGVATSASLLVFPLCQSLLTMGAAMTLTAIASAVLLASVSTMSVMVGRELGMGSTMGFLSTSNSIGMVFGCISLGLMPEIGFTYESFFYLSSVVVIICTILFAILWDKRKMTIRERAG